MQCPEKRKKVLSFLLTPKLFLVDTKIDGEPHNVTRQAWREVPGGSRRGELLWGIQLYFPRTAIQRWGVEEGGMQGEGCVISILPLRGGGGLFLEGRIRRQEHQAFNCSQLL